jgi:hypothetical protein
MIRASAGVVPLEAAAIAPAAPGAGVAVVIREPSAMRADPASPKTDDSTATRRPYAPANVIPER